MGELERGERCPFLVFFYADRRAAGKCRGKKWTPFFPEEIDKERGRGKKKFEREPTHRLATSPPSMPHLITHMGEGKKGSSRTPLPSFSLQRAAPRRTARGMTCLLGATPPFSMLGEEIERGVGEDFGLFCLPPRCDQPGDRRPPSRPDMDGTTDSCRAAIWGVTTPRCCNLFFSELGGCCRGFSYCPPPVWVCGWTIGGACPAGWCPRRNRQSWWWLDSARSLKWLLDDHDEARWVHKSSGYHLSLLMVTTEQYRRSGHVISLLDLTFSAFLGGAQGAAGYV